MKKIIFSVLIFVSINFVFAQENTGQEFWITFQYTPKIGMNQKFETALAEKTKLYNKSDNVFFQPKWYPS